MNEIQIKELEDLRRRLINAQCSGVGIDANGLANIIVELIQIMTK